MANLDQLDVLFQTSYVRNYSSDNFSQKNSFCKTALLEVRDEEEPQSKQPWKWEKSEAFSSEKNNSFGNEFQIPKQNVKMT